jgi:hypothetical protein
LGEGKSKAVSSAPLALDCAIGINQRSGSQTRPLQRRF